MCSLESDTDPTKLSVPKSHVDIKFYKEMETWEGLRTFPWREFGFLLEDSLN